MKRLLLLLFLSTEAFCQEPAIVHIAITDELALTNETNAFIRRLYTEAFPDREFIQVSVSVPRLLRLPEAWYRRKAMKALRAKLRSDLEISHLIVSTHGSTTKTEEPKTSLDIMGTFGSSGLDPKLQEFLTPLVGHFTPDAHVFFDSCSTFCGTDEEVGKRAQRFLTDLGIPNGRVYGAHIDTGPPIPPGSVLPLSIFYLNKPLTYVLGPAVVFQAFVILEGLLARHQSVQELFSTALFESFVTSGLLAIAVPFGKLLAYGYYGSRYVAASTTGKIVRLENGTVTVTPLHQMKDAAQVYGISASLFPESCAKLLAILKPRADASPENIQDE